MHFKMFLVVHLPQIGGKGSKFLPARPQKKVKRKNLGGPQVWIIQILIVGFCSWVRIKSHLSISSDSLAAVHQVKIDFEFRCVNLRDWPIVCILVGLHQNFVVGSGVHMSSSN